MPVNNNNINRFTDKICEHFGRCDECVLQPYKYPTGNVNCMPTFWCDEINRITSVIAATRAFQEVLAKYPELRKDFSAEDVREIGGLEATVV